MRLKERAFLRCKQGRLIVQHLRYEFTMTRNKFDKRLRQCERMHNKSMANDIETMSTNNPNDFWKKVKELGPRKSQSIPMEIVNENGDTVCDETLVFEKWKCDFENLYNTNESGNFDDAFYKQSIGHTTVLENNINDPLYNSNTALNKNISLDEVSSVIMNSKYMSAVGIDTIPYDVLKFPPVIAVIHQLFQLVFDTSIIPSTWRKAVIFPLHKDSTSDKRVPLHYRGISLLSCISKLYSSFLNKRLSKYLEENDLLAEELNGFRKSRSCEAHIFTVNSIIKNNKTVFATFVDFKKAFHFVHRDMLLYKLLLLKIDGKMYSSIKSIYANTTSCVRINGKLTYWLSCNSWVKQGDNLSHALFSLH